ncbi:unnamed protein product, partial [Discosporangium mesarthrocarpum]
MPAWGDSLPRFQSPSEPVHAAVEAASIGKLWSGAADEGPVLHWMAGLECLCAALGGTLAGRLVRSTPISPREEVHVPWLHHPLVAPGRAPWAVASGPRAELQESHSDDPGEVERVERGGDENGTTTRIARPQGSDLGMTGSVSVKPKESCVMPPLTLGYPPSFCRGCGLLSQLCWSPLGPGAQVLVAVMNREVPEHHRR